MNWLELLTNLEQMELILLAVVRNADHLRVVLLNELANPELVHRLLVDQIKNPNRSAGLRDRIHLHFPVNGENGEKTRPRPSQLQSLSLRLHRYSLDDVHCLVVN